MIALAFLLLLFLAIALRTVLGLRLQIWHMMLVCALLMLATLQIAPLEALAAIDWQVIAFLAGMFIIGEGLRQSGLLAAFVHGFMARFPRPRTALLVFMLLAGLLAALVTNDTIAVIGTPVALLLAARYGMAARVPLLALALAITLGSALSPLGNPQNLLVALSGPLKNPFLDFGWWLGLPSLVSMVAAWGALLLVFRKDLAGGSGAQDLAHGAVTGAGAEARDHAHAQAQDLARSKDSNGTTAVQAQASGAAHLAPPKVPDHPHTHGRLVALSAVSMGILVSLIVIRSLWSLVHLPGELPLWTISVAACLPLLFFTRKRTDLVRGMDWQTLVFFAALFVSVQAVWNQGVLQSLMTGLKLDLAAPLPLLAACLGFSQVVSNVPLVALFLPVLDRLGAPVLSYLVLAAGSTIAGNLTILGAASNVIILQQAEREAGRDANFSFSDMLRVGLPLTLVTVVVFLAWWRFLGGI